MLFFLYKEGFSALGYFGYTRIEYYIKLGYFGYTRKEDYIKLVNSTRYPKISHSKSKATE